MEATHWRSGTEGGRHASAGVKVTGLGGVGAGESLQRVGEGGHRPWEGGTHSVGRDGRAVVTGCAGPEVEAGCFSKS